MNGTYRIVNFLFFVSNHFILTNFIQLALVFGILKGETLYVYFSVPNKRVF